HRGSKIGCSELHLSTSQPMSGGYHPWSKFNAHRWSNLNARRHSQWAACAAQELKRQDVTLNAEYTRLRKALSAEQKEALTKAQKSWLKFREDWCRFEEIGPSAPGGEANYNFCLMDLTNRQIDRIKESQP
ncbi:lysozyme inhibitor LprI family protein, partial [Pseudomonas putida]|uniref:lysozyme inhibitor LprI family protein n=1 Tax=Pseudomonas putida TaxID=303 RepID=UPI0035D4BE87